MRDLTGHFEDVYVATYPDLVRFAVRRTDAGDAEDIAAEAFSVAWRRQADLPEDLDAARAWLFGIARRLLMARYREAGRGVPVRLGDPDVMVPAVPGHAEGVAAAVDLTTAWRRLDPSQQEAISLAVWEGLPGAQAARVLGISAVAYRIRLSRARRALRRLVHASPSVPTGTPVTVTEGASHER